MFELETFAGSKPFCRHCIEVKGKQRKKCEKKKIKLPSDEENFEVGIACEVVAGLRHLSSWVRFKLFH